jgi:hypothetical protein
MEKPSNTGRSVQDDSWYVNPLGAAAVDASIAVAQRENQTPGDSRQIQTRVQRKNEIAKQDGGSG